MARLLTGSIDLSKIDKTKIQTVGKDGQPFKNGAKYLSISVWVEDQNQVDKYGNIASVSFGTSKDDRVYFGNLKEFIKDTAGGSAIPTAPASDDDLPF
jgi:hypothetical protein